MGNSHGGHSLAARSRSFVLHASSPAHELVNSTRLAIILAHGVHILTLIPYYSRPLHIKCVSTFVPPSLYYKLVENI